MAFARKVWKLLVGIKDGLALLFLLLFFGLIYAVLSMRPNPGAVVDGALLLELDGFVVEEAAAPDPVQVLLSQSAPTGQYEARAIERALRLAAKDERIKVVVLDLSRFLGGGQVHMEEIGEAIDTVRAAGKPVMAFANFYGDDAMLLAAHASETWVDPMGGAFIAGPGGSFMYYKQLLDRLEVKAHVYRVGRYKSYVEPYERSDMSPEAREANEALYGALWQDYGRSLKKARPKLQLARVTGDPVGWVESANGNVAQAAKAAGMVDRIGSKSQFDLAVAKVAGTVKPEANEAHLPFAHTSFDTWLAANPFKPEGAAIGVVTVSGEIVDGEAGPGVAGGDRIARLLDDNLDTGLKALVVRVNSPGGSTMASERIRLALERYREKNIPVVISMGNMAASGGYWISTAGDQIFAQPATITGSIGVFAVITSFEDTLAKFGVTTDTVRTTPLSGQPDVFGGFTPEVERLLQASIDNTYDRFLGLVAKARGKTPEQVDAEAQGHTWDGRTAMELGLVDRMGDLDDALAYAANAAKLGNGKWYPKYLRSEPGTLASLLSGTRTRARSERGAVYDFAGWAAQRRAADITRIGGQLDSILGARSAQAFCLECPALPGAAVADRDALKVLAALWRGSAD